MPISDAQFKTGDFVEYRPIGGSSDKVHHSRGIIEQVYEAEDGTIRYSIHNKNTDKTSNYRELSIVKKIDDA